MRTTLDIDDPILAAMRAIAKKEGRSMGTVASELLADAIARRQRSHTKRRFQWTSRAMTALVDLNDKDAVYAILDSKG